MVKLSTNEFKEKVVLYNRHLNLDSVEYKNNRQNVMVRCRCGYCWEVSPKTLVRSKVNCPKCNISGKFGKALLGGLKR